MPISESITQNHFPMVTEFTLTELKTFGRLLNEDLISFQMA